MVNEKFRKALENYCKINELSEDEQPLIFDNSSYDNAIIGITINDELVYDYDRMVEEFMLENNCKYEEAQEWVDCNTIKALSYNSSEHKPIIIYSKELFEKIYD